MSTRTGGKSRGGNKAWPRKTEAGKARLKRARAARKAEKKAQAEVARTVEAEEQVRRRASRERPRWPVEPPIYNEGEDGPFRAGWVAMVGRPNVGKSTLLNALLGQKLAPTSHKPQTTRKNLLGVLNPEGGQILLMDTPGHHQAKGPLNRFMVSQANEALREADVILYVAEARIDGQITPGNERLLGVLKKGEKPVVVALNKVDRIRDKKKLLLHIETLRDQLGDVMVGMIPISAMNKEGLKQLVVELGRALPESEPLVDPDEVTDQSERQVVSEFIREKAMLELKDEIPYSVAVTVDRFEDLRPKLARIWATLHVERPSQKGIVIGKQGARLKSIGSRARKDIEFFLGVKVYMELAVRVTTDWTKDNGQLKQLGYTKKDQDQLGGPQVLPASEWMDEDWDMTEDEKALLEGIDEAESLSSLPKIESSRSSDSEDVA